MVVILLKPPFLSSNRPRTARCVDADGVRSGTVRLEKGSNRCKPRPVFSLSPFSSRFAPSHTLNAEILFKPFFLDPKSAKDTAPWCLDAHGVRSGALVLNKGGNRCKSRPVFSLSPFSSRIAPGHTLNGGDFAQTALFVP